MTSGKKPCINVNKKTAVFCNQKIGVYFRMARASPAMSNNTAIPSVSFHRRTFGKNIQLDDNALKATRHTSFDNGYFFI